MAKRTLKKKGKKEWYHVVAPDIFKNQELGEIMAYDPRELIGRQVQLDYSVLTNSPRDKSKNFVLKVKDVVEKKARTEPVKVIYSLSFIQRASGRSKTRALHVGKYSTADAKTATVKLYLLARDRVVRSVNTALLKKVDALLKSRINKVESAKLFEPNYLESLSKELKSKLRTIYPLSSVLFWKAILS